MALVDVELATGMFTHVRNLNLPGNLEQYPRWSPDGRGFAARRSVRGASISGWQTSRSRRHGALTDFPGNERSAAWQTSPLQLYFRRDAWERLAHSDDRCADAGVGPRAVARDLRSPGARRRRRHHAATARASSWRWTNRKAISGWWSGSSQQIF